MYIGFYNRYEIYNKNKMFTDASSPIGDDLMYPMVHLGRTLTSHGHKINTIDMDELRKFDAIVFLDFPTFKNSYFKKLVDMRFDNLYLMTWEAPSWHPDNYVLSNYKYFKKIFTWQDNLIDNKKYFKINFSHRLPADIGQDMAKKSKFCAMISGNKFMGHPGELYTERIHAVRWFEKNHPEEFDLYGLGWDEHTFQGGRLVRNLNRIRLLRRLFAAHYPSYRGTVKRKRRVLAQYKFSICYENIANLPGWITEKIFDCFLAGCVPVYLGAGNVTEHIPGNCFIDKREFKTYEDLYSYMKGMSDTEYGNYLRSIGDFLKGEASHPFSAEYLSRVVMREITG